MIRKCKNCQGYIKGGCSGSLPGMLADECRDYCCYTEAHVVDLVKATETLCEVAECAPGFIEKVYAALEPFQYM